MISPKIKKATISSPPKRESYICQHTHVFRPEDVILQKEHREKDKEGTGSSQFPPLLKPFPLRSLWFLWHEKKKDPFEEKKSLTMNQKANVSKELNAKHRKVSLSLSIKVIVMLSGFDHGLAKFQFLFVFLFGIYLGELFTWIFSLLEEVWILSKAKSLLLLMGLPSNSFIFSF
jgi:hypothetical protein